eukprot:CAMPEP_0172481024 /NCGR_PEP_ID=MMETSP1066-20121228/6548_1 /TAXON_ID=671091 /ORGANISM="Coscinodiscus wailesii, Strain CCMP2513" /LENGTH=375 /DNA_ID=CAMNT_0013242913 /DNA_START=91 /DNA_END=1218 /DNA_ORIENTATION=-
MELRTTESEISELASLYNELRNAVVGGTSLAPSLPSLASFILEADPTNATDSENKTADENGDGAEAELSTKEMSHRDVLFSIESLDHQLKVLEDRTNRFRKRLNEKDPITGAARYGEKTTNRVKTLLQTYDALTAASRHLHQSPDDDNDNALLAFLRDSVNKQDEALQKQKTEAEEKEKLAQKALLESETRRRTEEAQRTDRESAARIAAARELAERAQASREQRTAERSRREDEERRAAEAERAADRAFVDSVPKGAEGVRLQLKALREGVTDAGARGAALGALHTLFSQIVARPEEIAFRRIRCDHEKFVEDIGRHVGGREVLVAAGFRLEMVDGVKCFFSREPDIEREMDEWSKWFDDLKETLEIIEEELIK